jgi:excinuclease ABC subunit C
MKTEQLKQQLKALPASPGVYLFRGEESEVLYVGKAASLSDRMRSYFTKSSNLSLKTQRLVMKISDLEFVVTNSEQEALLLECDMIKKYRPQFNIRLKDNKTFPYLKVAVNEDWPGVYITRRLQQDGARYFGPFASAGSVRKTLKLIRKIFPFRTCTKSMNGSDKRPCLDYYIHRCLGPCIGAADKQEYQEVIKQVILFLEGKQELVLRELKDKMKASSRELQFERAALLRDQIQTIEKVIEGQKIALTLKGEQDVIALTQNEGQAYVEIFFVRSNKLVGRDHFIMEGASDELPSQVITSFIKQYYASASYIPPLILLQYPVSEREALLAWLRQRRKSGVKIQVPKVGVKKQLVNMVAENASRGFQLARAKYMNSQLMISSLQELKDRLCLPRIPLTIECYDISDIQGASAVGSMVFLERGLPNSARYRRFRIKGVLGVDDYAMIQELLRRRFKRGMAGEDGWSVFPDLALIDGGRGHLASALQVKQELGVDIPMASLAKEHEDVFIQGKSSPIEIPKDSPALHVLQRARDEAHRFANAYHRKVRRKETFSSVLDGVPGVGPKRKESLMRSFGSIEAIKVASEEELRLISGMTPILARRLKEYL